MRPIHLICIAASLTIAILAVSACGADGVMQDVSAAAARGDAAAESQRALRVPGQEPAVLGPAAGRAFEEYRSPRYPDFKAFYYSPGIDRWGSAWGYRHPEQAILRAQGGCEGRFGVACRIYAIGDRIVAGLAAPELQAVSDAYYQSVVSRRERLSPGMRRLTGDEIRSVLGGGAVAEVTSVNGTRATARLFADGRMSVTLLPGIPGRNGRPADTGTWWIENDMFCRRYTRWNDGIPECQWIMKEGETFKVFDESMMPVSSFVLTGNRLDHKNGPDTP